MPRPRITIKLAQTIDGKIAAADHSSKWITGPSARIFARALRAANDGILVGVNTVLKDNPLLTARFPGKKNPARIILDSRLKTPLASNIVRTAGSTRTIILTTGEASRQKIKKLCGEKVTIHEIKKDKNGMVDLNSAMQLLYKKKLRKIIVEGGSKVVASFIKKRFVDKLIFIIAPKILGKGMEAVGDVGVRSIDKAIKLKIKNLKRFGEDMACTMLVKK